MIIDGGIGFLLLLQDFRISAPNILTDFFIAMSDYYFSILILPILAFAFLFWCVNKKYGAYMGFNMVNIMTVMSSLKAFLAVPRPWILNPELQPIASEVKYATGCSCPSGHASSAMYMWGTLGVILRKKTIALIFCAVMVFLISFSRLYLGVHTPLDVGLAIAVGAVILFINWKLINYLENHPEKDLAVLIIELIITLALLMPCLFVPEYVNATGEFTQIFPSNAGDVFTYTGLSFGFFIGWFVERRFIKYEIPASWKIRVLEFIPGAAVVSLIQLGLCGLLMKFIGVLASEFITLFILTFFITAVYPWILKIVQSLF